MSVFLRLTEHDGINASLTRFCIKMHNESFTEFDIDHIDGFALLNRYYPFIIKARELFERARETVRVRIDMV